MTDQSPDSDEALGSRLAGELPRHSAPPRLRAAIVTALEPRPRRAMWFVPLVSAAATALIFALIVLPLLPRTVPADPALRLARAVVSEHSRALMWGARKPEIYPAALSELSEEAGVSLQRVFVGDDLLLFVAAEPVYLERLRGIAVYYRDADGHLVTYMALPAPGVTVPERRRVQIEKWRPALVHDSGFATLVWKQGDIACFLVADMVSEDDHTRFRDYFVRVRSGTEPTLPN